MKQVLHFNKVIKFVIIFGDLCLLNIIFISLYHIFDYQTLGNEFTFIVPAIGIIESSLSTLQLLQWRRTA